MLASLFQCVVQCLVVMATSEAEVETVVLQLFKEFEK